MGLFKKNKKDNDKKNSKRRSSLVTSFDSMKYCTPKDGSENETYEISNLIIDGYGVLANFNNINDDEVNIMLAFISGVVYATYGELYQLDSRLFLFGRKEAFEDGTLHQYVEDIK